MKIELYKYGLSNAIEAIDELLWEALQTRDKNKKAAYINEARGMVKTIDMLINEEEIEINT